MLGILKTKKGTVLALLQWFRTEPFVHFLALGAIIFIAYCAMNTGARGQNDRIEITAAGLERLRATAQQQWGKAPDALKMEFLAHADISTPTEAECANFLALDTASFTATKRRLNADAIAAMADAVRTDAADWQALGLGRAVA